jgi:hypothetical protein
VILLDQGESEINAGSDTCGRPYLSGLDEERLGIDANFREFLGKLRTRAPMGDDAALVEQTNFGQGEGVGARRGFYPLTPGSVPPVYVRPRIGIMPAAPGAGPTAARFFLRRKNEHRFNGSFLTDVARPRYHRWRSFLLREKFENRARLEVKAFVVVDGKDLSSRIGLYAQRRSGSYAPSIGTTFRSALNPNRGAPARIASLINDGARCP